MTTTPQHRGERGMTMVELCIVIVILGVLMTVAVAALFRARTVSNEASAVSSLRAIYSAQFSYTAACGAGNYATTLTALTLAPPGGSEGYLSQDLGGSNNPQRNGYRFTLRQGQGAVRSHADCHGAATQTRYYAAATPTVPGNTGNNAYAINQSGAVWQVSGSSPPAEPFGAPAELVK
jgi:type IV pilus assembly protein PilA